MKGQNFRSIEEFRRYFFPQQYAKDMEERRTRDMTPEQLGRYLARKTLKEISKNYDC